MAPRKVKTGRSIPFFTFLRAIFSARLDFPSPPLSAPGSFEDDGLFQEEKNTIDKLFSSYVCSYRIT